MKNICITAAAVIVIVTVIVLELDAVRAWEDQRRLTEVADNMAHYLALKMSPDGSRPEVSRARKVRIRSEDFIKDEEGVPRVRVVLRDGERPGASVKLRRGRFRAEYGYEYIHTGKDGVEKYCLRRIKRER